MKKTSLVKHDGALMPWGIPVEDWPMSPRRHSADLRGRRHDLGIGVRDMAAGLGIGLGRLLRIEDGTAAEEDRTFYRTWLSRIEGWSAGERRIEACEWRRSVQIDPVICPCGHEQRQPLPSKGLPQP